MFRAIDYTLQNLSPRNLPKFGPGDWNDTLDYLGRKGKGESIMNAMLLCFVLKEAIELCDRLNLIEKKNEYELAHQKISKTVNEECWDGEWYIRGTNDEGDVIGSKKCEEGKIFLNAQNWAVIGGVANRERAIRAMNSVKKHLDTPKGPKLLHPAYTKINPNIGLATRCVPGKKENGAVFNHGVSWAILAECLLGRGDIAYEYYRKALPMNPVIDIDRYEVEPYVYAEYVTSPDHPTFGQASHSWLTGTAVWMLRDGIDYILGAQPTYDGLKINPCIPSNWKKYKITRRFRGDIYEITVKNPKGVCTGIKSIKVDGKKIKGDILPLFGDKQVHKVDVVMG
jgi:cellobiose phosphorylase